MTASLVGNAISLQVASGPSQTSLTLGGGTNAITMLGLTGFVGTNQGTVTPGAANAMAHFGPSPYPLVIKGPSARRGRRRGTGCAPGLRSRDGRAAPSQH